MTNRQFIQSDVLDCATDFTDEEVKAIQKEMKEVKWSSMLDAEYEGYDAVNNFYQDAFKLHL